MIMIVKFGVVGVPAGCIIEDVIVVCIHGSNFERIWYIEVLGC